jgi:hypothetical protein
LSLDRAAYANEPRQVARETLDWAWDNYFTSTDEADFDSGERR